MKLYIIVATCLMAFVNAFSCKNAYKLEHGFALDENTIMNAEIENANGACDDVLSECKWMNQLQNGFNVPGSRMYGLVRRAAALENKYGSCVGRNGGNRDSETSSKKSKEKSAALTFHISKDEEKPVQNNIPRNCVARGDVIKCSLPTMGGGVMYNPKVLKRVLYYPSNKIHEEIVVLEKCAKIYRLDGGELACTSPVPVQSAECPKDGGVVYIRSYDDVGIEVKFERENYEGNDYCKKAFQRLF